MSLILQNIIYGTYANDGTGDDLRTAFRKTHENFQALLSGLTVAGAANIGTGVGVYAQTVDGIVQLKSLKGSSGVDITPDSTSLTFTIHVQGDASPVLGGNLNLNNHNIIGLGDVQTSVYGLDVRDIDLRLRALSGDLDLGTFGAPGFGNVDLGAF
jgi:hypothetical protein